MDTLQQMLAEAVGYRVINTNNADLPVPSKHAQNVTINSDATVMMINPKYGIIQFLSDGDIVFIDGERGRNGSFIKAINNLKMGESYKEQVGSTAFDIYIKIK